MITDAYRKARRPPEPKIKRRLKWWHLYSVVALLDLAAIEAWLLCESELFEPTLWMRVHYVAACGALALVSACGFAAFMASGATIWRKPVFKPRDDS